MVTTKIVEDKQVWEDFLATHPEANFLQSWLWGEFYEVLGKSVYHSGFYDGETLVGVMLSIVEPARRGRYLTVPGGPIIDWQNDDFWKAAVQEMKRVGKLEKCVFVRVRPQIIENEQNSLIFHKAGFRIAQMHLHA
jgi:lipid II:glycine glycyltransferase (peptidoglycan interpeptide bridge formation enzyme)